MYVDPSGYSPEWWQWALSGLTLAAGIACCIFVPGGQVFGVSLIVSGASSLTSNILNATGVSGKTATIITSALDIVAGVALCFTPFASVGANMIGSGVGSLALGFAFEALGLSFDLGAVIGNIAGGIIGGQIHNKISNYLRCTVVVDGKRVPVYRGGNSMTLSNADIKQYNSTLGKAGLSLNTDVNNTNIIKYGGANKIKYIPKQLKIVITKGTHCTIIPNTYIDVFEYQKLLNIVKLVRAN
jgi:hypothetical protein